MCILINLILESNALVKKGGDNRIELLTNWLTANCSTTELITHICFYVPVIGLEPTL